MFGKKRAQISLFVIVGLVILIVIFLMISLRNMVSTPVESATAEKMTYELQAGVLKDHVVSCINAVASDALEKLGESGGMIYDYEGGKIPFKSFVLGANHLDYSFQSRKYHVAYGLRENHYCKKISYHTPEYPLSGIPFSDFNKEYNSGKECLLHHPTSDYDGFFGAVNISKLCYSARSSGCEPFAEGSIMGLTIQKQLEDYVSTHLPLCVNLSAFSSRMSAEIVQESLPSVEADIHDSETLFFVRYPVRIIFKDREPVSLVAEYQSRLDVRLGALYNFIYNVLSADSKNIKFNPATQYTTLPYWKQGLSLERIQDACKECPLPYSKDDILEFKDSNSLVNGHPLIFRIAVQDRRPAIDFIPDQLIDWQDKRSSGQPRFSPSIFAYDPDDTPLKYYFISEGLDGWKEKSDFDRIQRDLNGVPPTLDLSISAADVGKHRIGVLVIDDSGLFDYQWFNFTMINSKSFQSSSECLSNCTNSGAQHYDVWCDDWCLISSNQCSAGSYQCLGRWWDENPANPLISCKDCVDNVFGFYDQEPHDDCRKSVYSSYESCSAMIPDCFWVNESKSSEPTNYQERCVNDFELFSLGVPGLPEFPKYIVKK